ncbi:MAG: DUF4215 domain-containing protein [Myxococcota bacterium]
MRHSPHPRLHPLTLSLVGCVLGYDPVPESPVSVVTLREGEGEGEGKDPVCGNGRVEPGEQCDLGFANAPQGPCREDCRAPRCGDGIPDEGERCDDGNDDDHDGCRTDCQRPLRSTWVRAPRGGEQPAIALGLALDPSGGVVVVGRGQAANGAPMRAWLAGYAPDGEQRWAQWLPADPVWDTATAQAIVIDPAGDLWVTGHVRVEPEDEDDNGDEDDLWVARCDPEGTPRWTFIDDLGGHHDRGLAIALDPQGAVVAGHTVIDARNRDGVVLAFDGDGQTRWSWRYDGPARGIDDARAVAVASDGSVVVGGGGDDLTHWWLTKLDAAGRPLGSSRIAGTVGAWVEALAIDDGGDLWVAGTEVLDAPDAFDERTWHTQPFLARLDAAAGIRWIRSEPPEGPTRREAFGLALDPDGGATIVGTDPIPGTICSRSLCPGRLWLARYAGDGTRRYWAIPDEMVMGQGRAVVLDADRALWLAGSRRLVYSEADAWLGRYRSTEPMEASP